MHLNHIINKNALKSSDIIKHNRPVSAQNNNLLYIATYFYEERYKMPYINIKCYKHKIKLAGVWKHMSYNYYLHKTINIDYLKNSQVFVFKMSIKIKLLIM